MVFNSKSIAEIHCDLPQRHSRPVAAIATPGRVAGGGAGTMEFEQEKRCDQRSYQPYRHGRDMRRAAAEEINRDECHRRGITYSSAGNGERTGTAHRHAAHLHRLREIVGTLKRWLASPVPRPASSGRA